MSVEAGKGCKNKISVGFVSKMGMVQSQRFFTLWEFAVNGGAA